MGPLIVGQLRYPTDTSPYLDGDKWAKALGADAEWWRFEALEPRPRIFEL